MDDYLSGTHIAMGLERLFDFHQEGFTNNTLALQ